MRQRPKQSCSVTMTAQGPAPRARRTARAPRVPQYREDGSGDRIVAVFENTERAATAREALIGDGVDNARMELIDRRSDLDNLAALKRHALPDEDTHLFAESLGRGHAILVIRAASGEHDRIMQVLSRFNPIDIEEARAAVTQRHLVHRHRRLGGAGPAAARTTSAPRRPEPTTPRQAAPTLAPPPGLACGATEARKGHPGLIGGAGGRQACHRAGPCTGHELHRRAPGREDMTVRDERVEIEHRPISRTGDLSMPQEREIEVVERHEEPVVEKRVTGNEEIVVRKEVVERPETVRGHGARDQGRGRQGAGRYGRASNDDDGPHRRHSAPDPEPHRQVVPVTERLPLGVNPPDHVEIRGRSSRGSRGAAASPGITKRRHPRGRHWA